MISNSAWLINCQQNINNIYRTKQTTTNPTSRKNIKNNTLATSPLFHSTLCSSTRGPTECVGKCRTHTLILITCTSLLKLSVKSMNLLWSLARWPPPSVPRATDQPEPRPLTPHGLHRSFDYIISGPGTNPAIMRPLTRGSSSQCSDQLGDFTEQFVEQTFSSTNCAPCLW